MTAPTILVTDPEQRAALAAVRSLGSHGYRVVVIGRSTGIAGRSRFCDAVVTVPSEVPNDPVRFQSAVAAAVTQHGVQVVLPVTDAASRVLLGRHAEVGARVAGPSRDAYLRASDKRALLEIAPRCGIRVPRQATMEQPGADIGVARQFSALVVKPSQSVVEVEGRSVGTSVAFVPTANDLTRALEKFPAAAYPLMLQERTYGVGVGVFLLRHKGKTLLQFGHQRLREKPPAGGVSTYRESIAPPAPLLQSCEQLLDELGYEGAAMIEFKRDAVTGEHVLMEINARLWGSVQLAVDAGVNFPLALVQGALGQPFTGLNSAKVGVRSVWELGELDHMWALLRRSPEQLQLPPGDKSGLPAVVKALFNRRLGDYPEVFRLSDPMPFFAEFSRWIRAR